MTSNEPAPDLPHRGTFDLVVLLLTSTVCTTILLLTITLGALTIFHPERDYSDAAKALMALLGTIIGALLGWIARGVKIDLPASPPP